MTGPSAPPPKGGRPTPSTPLRERMFGLWVDLGDWRPGRGWRRAPEARFTCRHGCLQTAVGAVEVTAFTARITAEHAGICPGPRDPG